VLDLEVDFLEGQASFTVPDEQLPAVIRLLRQNLEFAVDLYREVNPIGFPHIPPIEPDPNFIGESADRGFGINPSVFAFVELFFGGS
jgi:hypothetical protein